MDDDFGSLFDDFETEDDELDLSDAGLSSGIGDASNESSFESSYDYDDNDDDDPAFNTSEDSNERDPKILKIAIGIIIAGILVLVIAGRLMSCSGTPKEDTYSNQTSEKVSVTSETNKEQSSASANSSSISPSLSGSEWKEFSENAKDIGFEPNIVETVFTVTNISNYVSKVNSNGDLRVKTIATGSIDGFRGTFQIELPYDKGSLIGPGTELDVAVSVGSYGENIIVGEIEVR